MDNSVIKRDYFYDNIKGLLIFLVVFAHILELTKSDLGLRDLVYHSIYLFHMPLFVLISGFFTKNFNIRTIINLLLTYILWQTVLYPIFCFFLSDKTFSINFHFISRPRWAYWYLLSLIAWKTVTPLLPKKYWLLPVIFVISLIPSLFNWMDWRDFSIGRTFGFFPFFYLGFILNDFQIKQIKYHINKKISVIIGIFVLANSYYFFIHKDLTGRILAFGKESFLNLNISIIDGIFIRLWLIILAILSIIALLPWINNKINFLTKWGQKTLPIYLTHTCFLYTLKQYSKFNITHSKQAFQFLIFSFILAVGYCYLFSQPKISKIINKFSISIIPNKNKN